MNKYKDFDWVKKVILSCKTFKQSSSSYNLIINYNIKYKDSLLYKELVGVESDNYWKLKHKL